MKTKGTLFVRELKVETIIGFYPEERKNKQPVVINLAFEVDEPESVAKDDVSYTINYAEITDEIYNFVKASSFNLLEKLGSEVAKIVMKNSKIKRAEIEVNKPEAPLPNTKGSAYRLIVER